MRNIKYMRAFAEAYPYFGFVQQPVAQIQSADNQQTIIVQQAAAQLPWGHHIIILTKVKTTEERHFYMQKCIENNWSRDVLGLQIESDLHKRLGSAFNNFNTTLTTVEADLANATFKNPYLFDFLSLGEKAKERDLERALIAHLKNFMLELGRGFAYVGNQYNLIVEEDDYFLDLLFYNIQLHCYVVFELKIGPFKPEYAGKLNFYINTLDAKIKSAKDKPTIGILLCKTPNETVVKFALQNIKAPIGIAEYQLADALPSNLKGEMPSIEELEKEIEEGYEELKSPAQKRFEGLKEKLAALKGNELKQMATTEILHTIFDESLVPLYSKLLLRMKDFEDLFLSCRYHWQGINTIDKLEDVAPEWKGENLLNNQREFYFCYQLHGFKKGGTDTFSISFQLNYIITTYWYGFTLVNYNNQNTFLKKLYGEQLTAEDIETIIDVVCNEMINETEIKMEHLKK